MTDKFRSIAILMIAEVGGLSLWFVSASILPDLAREMTLDPFRQAALSSAVQIGFVVGALISAATGLSDRYDPRKVFAVCAMLAAAANLLLITVEPGGAISIAARFITGALLAGVYPVGMKIAVGWGQADRGLLVGLLVGALTLGSALPYLIAFTGGTDWRWTVSAASAGAFAAGLLIFLTRLGPFHAPATRFRISTIALAWREPKLRYAYGGYLGHMWELYVMWGWIAAACAVSFQSSMESDNAAALAQITAFAAIATGGLFCALAGVFADRIGKARIASLALAISGVSALATAMSLGGPVWITVVFVIIWGASVVPDSAQFSALVADASPPEAAGSLMTFQTALGFALTFVTVQVAPSIAASYGWATVLALTALGPVFGLACMAKLIRMERA